MGIAEFLDAPDGAVLVAIAGEVELVTTRHVSPTRLTIEREPLGPVASVDAVVALLGAEGFLPAAGSRTVQPLPALTVDPARPAGDAEPEHVCPECGKRCASVNGLGVHRKKVHGVPSRFEPANVGDHVCGVCGRRFDKPNGLTMHEKRKHAGGQALPVTPPVTPQLVELPPPVSLDGGSLLESQDASQGQSARHLDPPVVRAMPVDPRGTCETCGLPNRNHSACEECSRRIGPGHTVAVPARQLRGKVWCASCVDILRLAV